MTYCAIVEFWGVVSGIHKETLGPVGHTPLPVAVTDAIVGGPAGPGGEPPLGINSASARHASSTRMATSEKSRRITLPPTPRDRIPACQLSHSKRNAP